MPDASTGSLANPNPWDFPDWQYIGDDGNRWDDPHRVYRVLYAGVTVLGCFLEVLARFRPDPRLVDAFEQISINVDDLPATEPPGTLRREWLENRSLADVSDTYGAFADVGNSKSLACLNQELVSLINRFGLDELDGAAIRQKAPRALTQALSRHGYESTTESGELFGGIHYLSRWGDDLANYALFEGDDRWHISEVVTHDLSDYLTEFHKALEMHGITLVD